MRATTSLAASIFGGAAGLVAGLLGDGLASGFFAGVVAGGIVGFVFSLAPRSEQEPRVAIESLSPAGFMGGVAGSVVANAGWLGGLISCAAGWFFGLVGPALFIASAMPRTAHRALGGSEHRNYDQPIEKEDYQAQEGVQRAGILEDNLASAIEAANKAAECVSTRRSAEGCITESDDEKFGSDMVDLLRRLARGAILLGHGIQTAPVTASDSETFGDELIDLMRRAARDAAVDGYASAGDSKKVDKHDAEVFGDDLIACAWRVVFDELRRLRQVEECGATYLGEPSTLEQMGMGSWPEEDTTSVKPPLTGSGSAIQLPLDAVAPTFPGSSTTKGPLRPKK